jgi:hypothetical protein
MTARHKFKMPFLAEPQAAARTIVDAVAAGRVRVVFPWQLRIGVALLSLLPRSIADALLPGADGS